KAAVAVAKANLTLARQEYDRWTTLAAQDATTKRKGPGGDAGVRRGQGRIAAGRREARQGRGRADADRGRQPGSGGRADARRQGREGPGPCRDRLRPDPGG